LKHLFIYGTFLLFLSLGISACDQTTGPTEIFKDKSAIIDFDISPSDVQFSSTQDGIKDTTIQVTFEATTLNLDDDEQLTLYIVNRLNDEVLLQRTLEESSTENEFELTIPFETRTTFFSNYLVYLRISSDKSNSSYAQGNLKITGFSVIPPEILATNNPESVVRPSSGNVAASFRAKVLDEEGNDTIEGVYMRLVSQQTGDEVSGSPFQLYDNGENGGDITANDSTFTLTLQLNSSNQLQDYNLFYYAIDKGGLVSDTVQSTFRITE
jgi:hypothetical protein